MVKITPKMNLLKMPGESQGSVAIDTVLLFEHLGHEGLGVADFEGVVLIDGTNLKLAHQRFMRQAR